MKKRINAKGIWGLGLLCLILLILLASQVFDSATPDEEVQTGSDPAATGTEEADVITTASKVNTEEDFIKAIAKDGTWIIITLRDLTFDTELVVEGEFHDKGDAGQALYRKLAPYTENTFHQVVKRFTITAPKLTIKSPNTRLEGGTFVGDVYVEADGFTILDARVEGNVYFAQEEYKTSFRLYEGVVTGETAVK